MVNVFVGACVFALIVGMIEQHKEFFSAVFGIIGFIILILIVIFITKIIK